MIYLWIPNAGNFQEYTYECEWLECDWKHVHKTSELVTANNKNQLIY